MLQERVYYPKKNSDFTHLCPTFENTEHFSDNGLNKCSEVKLPTSCDNLITKIACETFS